VQVLDSAYVYLGQDEWQQSPSKPVYEHVFAVSNTCSFPLGITSETEFTFKVVSSDPSTQDCLVCMLWDNPPAKKQMIKVQQ
jgi:hypothetical protein